MVGDPISDMDVEYARTVADRAMQLMSQQSVPATPSNFSVWFDYAMSACASTEENHRHSDRQQA